MAYRPRCEETPFIEAIRKTVISGITPVMEVMGANRMVTFQLSQANQQEGAVGCCIGNM